MCQLYNAVRGRGAFAKRSQDEDALSRLLKSLIDKGADLNAKESTFGWTALHGAIVDEYDSVARLLIDSGADLNVPDDAEGKTPLHLAITRRRTSIAKMLIERRADVSARDSHLGSTPLHVAAEHEDSGGDLVSTPPLVITKLLIAHGVEVNARNQLGETPLHRAEAFQANTAMAHLLIQSGADVNATTDDDVGGDLRSSTPLHYAVAGVASDYTHLVEAGADTTAVNLQGKTPLQLLKDKYGDMVADSHKELLPPSLLRRLLSTLRRRPTPPERTRATATRVAAAGASAPTVGTEHIVAQDTSPNAAGDPSASRADLITTICTTPVTSLVRSVLFSESLMDVSGEDVTFDGSSELREISGSARRGIESADTAALDPILKRYQRFLQEHPGNSVIYTLYAYALTHSGKDNEARRILDDGLKHAKCLSGVARAYADYWLDKSLDDTVKYCLLAGWCQRSSQPAEYALYLYLARICTVCDKREEARKLKTVADLLYGHGGAELTSRAAKFLSEASQLSGVEALVGHFCERVMPTLDQYLDSKSKTGVIVECGRCGKKSESLTSKCPQCGEVDRINTTCLKCGGDCFSCRCRM